MKINNIFNFNSFLIKELVLLYCYVIFKMIKIGIYDFEIIYFKFIPLGITLNPIYYNYFYFEIINYIRILILLIIFADINLLGYTYQEKIKIYLFKKLDYNLIDIIKIIKR